MEGGMKALLASYMDSAGSSLTGPPSGLLLPPDVELSLEPEPPRRSSSSNGREREASPHSQHLSGEMIRRILERSRSKPGRRPLLLSREDPGGWPLGEISLWGEPIQAFFIGGEPRCCLPQILNSILGSVSLGAIHAACDELRIYCPTCSPGQLSALKARGIIPSTAAQCGLIRRSDALRLFSLLLDVMTAGPPPSILHPSSGSVSLRVVHECFGRAAGLLHPGAYGGPSFACLTCLDCGGTFSPQRFVSHVHDAERAVVHWGFDSGNWRAYLRLDEDAYGSQGSREWEEGERLLEEVKGRYAGVSASGGSGKRELSLDISEVPHSGKKARMDSNSSSSSASSSHPFNNIYSLYNSWAAALAKASPSRWPSRKAARHSEMKPLKGGGSIPPPPVSSSSAAFTSNPLCSGPYAPAVTRRGSNSGPSVLLSSTSSHPPSHVVVGVAASSIATNPSTNNNTSSNNSNPNASQKTHTTLQNSNNNNNNHANPTALEGKKEDIGLPSLPLSSSCDSVSRSREDFRGAFNSSLAEDISAIRDALEGASAVAKERTLKTLERITARLAQTEMERDIALANLQELQRQNSETVAELFKKRAELRELLAQDSAVKKEDCRVSLEEEDHHHSSRASRRPHNNRIPLAKEEDEESEPDEKEDLNDDDTHHESNNTSFSSPGNRKEEEDEPPPIPPPAAPGGVHHSNSTAKKNNQHNAPPAEDSGKNLKDSEDLRERMVYMEAELRALRQELKARVVPEVVPEPPPPTSS